MGVYLRRPLLSAGGSPGGRRDRFPYLTGTDFPGACEKALKTGFL
jgi:hypothetical protein